MQKKYWYLIVAIHLLGFTALGQSLDSTQSIQEVQVLGQKDKYMVGSKVETLDSIKLETVSGSSLADVINHYLPIYVKQDAGGLATIHFRGTSADHTAIMFNGININSLTLGHSNLSNIPAFLFDDIKVQYGSSSSLYGTDAIGGSIHLNNKPEWNKGLSFGLQQDIASFDSYFTGFKTAYSNKRFRYSLKIFRQSKKNNFPFTDPNNKDFVTGEFKSDITRNAALCNYGLLQEIDYKISNNMFSYIKAWYQDNWHQIQANMSTNNHEANSDQIQNKSLRTVTGLKYYKNQHKFIADLGYVKDHQLYNKDQSQIISTNSFITNINYFNSKFLKGDLNTGFNYQHIKPEVHAYDANLKEDRFDLFLSYKKNVSKKLTGSLNIRESFVLNYKSQFTPSISFNYNLINSKKNSLDSKLSISKSYKIPTFNDRFWLSPSGEPQGNPNLLPESGMNYELGTKYQFKNKTNSYALEATGFYMDVDQWILWVPENNGIWRPHNKDRVECKGLELSFKSVFKIAKLEFRTGLHYSFNQVVLVEKYDDPDSYEIGKQLIYTPKHLGSGNLSVNYKKWFILTSVSYTGSRLYAHDETKERILEDYFLINTSIGKKLKIKKQVFLLDFNVYNLLNKSYQNQYLYAMPGINFAVSIKYSINNLKFKVNENN